MNIPKIKILRTNLILGTRRRCATFSSRFKIGDGPTRCDLERATQIGNLHVSQFYGILCGGGARRLSEKNSYAVCKRSFQCQ